MYGDPEEELKYFLGGDGDSSSSSDGDDSVSSDDYSEDSDADSGEVDN